jgi:hypothetical protein
MIVILGKASPFFVLRLVAAADDDDDDASYACRFVRAAESLSKYRCGLSH